MMKNKNELMDDNIQQLIDNLDDALGKLLDNRRLRLPFVDETGVELLTNNLMEGI